MEERSSDCRKKGVDILFLRFLKNMNIYIYIDMISTLSINKGELLTTKDSVNSICSNV